MKSQKQRKRKYVEIIYPTKRKKNNMVYDFGSKLTINYPSLIDQKKW